MIRMKKMKLDFGCYPMLHPAISDLKRLTACILTTIVIFQDLKDLMRRSGEVTFADAHKDRRNEG